MRSRFRTSFTRDIKKIKDRTTLGRIKSTIENVEAAETLLGIENMKKLTGTSNYYRIRLGNYRIGIIIDDDHIVDFLRCLHRRDLYRFFP